MDIEHPVPEASGGPTIEANLWLACSGCNQRKGTRGVDIDPATGEVVRLFDPRRQRWSDHFAWSDDATRIEGRTLVGRAAVVALDLNRSRLVVARELGSRTSLHPPPE